MVLTDVTGSTFSISEVANRTGVTAHTLRYYERIGLLDIDRLAGGHRCFAALDIDRVIFIGRLRATEMPIRDIQRYFALAAVGFSTEPERLQILKEHQVKVRARLGELERALDAIGHKITHYSLNCGPG
jgi:DNA-binding transcriptional MerR regulator